MPQPVAIRSFATGSRRGLDTGGVGEGRAWAKNSRLPGSRLTGPIGAVGRSAPSPVFFQPCPSSPMPSRMGAFSGVFGGSETAGRAFRSDGLRWNRRLRGRRSRGVEALRLSPLPPSSGPHAATLHPGGEGKKENEDRGPREFTVRQNGTDPPAGCRRISVRFAHCPPGKNRRPGHARPRAATVPAPRSESRPHHRRACSRTRCSRSRPAPPARPFAPDPPVPPAGAGWRPPRPPAPRRA